MAEREAEIRARCEAATPGEWSVIPKGNALSVVAKSGAFTLNICHYSHKDGADADFIAHARTDVPDLLAEVERLNKVVYLLESDRDSERRLRLWAESELSEAREALKGAKAICDVATSEKRKAEADRDEWRRRAEAAERDIEKMLRSMPVGMCKQFCKRAGSMCGAWADCAPEWRGPEGERAPCKEDKRLPRGGSEQVENSSYS